MTTITRTFLDTAIAKLRETLVNVEVGRDTARGCVLWGYDPQRDLLTFYGALDHRLEAEDIPDHLTWLTREIETEFAFMVRSEPDFGTVNWCAGLMAPAADKWATDAYPGVGFTAPLLINLWDIWMEVPSE